jgi:DNA modification methylase
VIAIIKRRAERYYRASSAVKGTVRLGDSRQASALKPESPDAKFDWIITSPPYYGMRTYIPDQWLRNWFVGGPDVVDYVDTLQLTHSGPVTFAADLRRVWQNAIQVCAKGARMVIRFGGIKDRNVDPLAIIKRSLQDSGWRISTIKNAGSATAGKRQADSFLRTRSKPMIEYDIWAKRE